MPIFFGHPPRKTSATKLAVHTSEGQFEPAEPSKVKVASRPTNATPLYQMITRNLGHLVSVLSFPPGSYLSFASPGFDHNPLDDEYRLPLRLPGLAFALRRGESLSDATTSELTNRGFTSINYSGKVVYLNDNPNRDDFLYIDGQIPNIIPTSEVPARFLNPQSFSAYLSFHSVTSAVCRAMYALSAGGPIQHSQLPADLDVKGYKHPSQWVTTDDMVVEAAMSLPEGVMNAKVPTGSQNTSYAKLKTMVLVADRHLANSTPTMIGNPFFNSRLPTFANSGDMSVITSHGLICKFKPQLALPDPNMIGDILARYFLTCLGSTLMEQFTFLGEIKAGLAGLRLTELGDAYSHLYKCIEIAIECEAGCIPYFSGGYYEGCIIQGGVGGHVYIHSSVKLFLDVPSLKDQFLTASDHGLAITFISQKFPSNLRDQVRKTETMFDLRVLCLDNAFSADDMQYVVEKAVDLRYGVVHWVVSPATLKKSLHIISHPNDLDATYPISRFTLFSKDPVLVALSVFGDAVPTWDIPSGTLNLLNKDAPPSPPAANQPRASAAGAINDAAWVMEVRRTSLPDAVESFRRLAAASGYRTVAAAAARKQGYFVFNRDRMNVFWAEMREAYRVLNPAGAQTTAEVDIKKRTMEVAVDAVMGLSKKRYEERECRYSNRLLAKSIIGDFESLRLYPAVDIWIVKRAWRGKDLMVVLGGSTFGTVGWIGMVSNACGDGIMGMPLLERFSGLSLDSWDLCVGLGLMEIV